MSDNNTIELAVLGMKCNGCAGSVKNALCEVDGVNEADVSIDDGIARVKLSDGADASPENLIEAIRDAGYNATLS